MYTQVGRRFYKPMAHPTDVEIFQLKHIFSNARLSVELEIVGHLMAIQLGGSRQFIPPLLSNLVLIPEIEFLNDYTPLPFDGDDIFTKSNGTGGRRLHSIDRIGYNTISGDVIITQRYCNANINTNILNLIDDYDPPVCAPVPQPNLSYQLTNFQAPEEPLIKGYPVNQMDNNCYCTSKDLTTIGHQPNCPYLLAKGTKNA